MNVMNTGIFKGLLLGLTACVLSACSQGLTFGPLQEIGSKSPPLTKARMASGAVTLAPPSGFCIDPSSLTQNFALMARCDVLGGKNGALDAPLGLITVSIAQNTGTPIDAAGLASASNATVVKALSDETVDMVRAETATPPDGLAQTHIRATAQIDGYDLSLALYAPEHSAAQGSRGVRMITELVNLSQNASVADAVAAQASTITTDNKKQPKAAFAALFD